MLYARFQTKRLKIIFLCKSADHRFGFEKVMLTRRPKFSMILKNHLKINVDLRLLELEC